MSNKAAYIKWLARKTGNTEIVKEATAQPAKAPDTISAQDYEYDSAEEPYVPIGMHGLMATTERLLAVNKGLAGTDFRDSQYFKKHFEADRQIWERIRTDVGNPRKKLLRMVSARKNLSSLVPFYFDDYTEKHISGNPLVTPLEEINPIHLQENSRRITGMGPGGIQSEDSITSDMNSVHPSQFGFIDAVAGPECFDFKSLVYTARGWIRWPEVKDDDLFACRIDGRIEFHKAERVIRQPYKGEMILAESGTCRMCVTPNHRVLYKSTQVGPERVDSANEVFGKSMVLLPTRSLPLEGNESFSTFKLPPVQPSVYDKKPQPSLPEFSIGDWCEFMGWWLSEGSSGVKGSPGHKGNKLCTINFVSISQCPEANPEEHERIYQLLLGMGLWSKDKVKNTKSFTMTHRELVSYFSMYKHGCYDKWIPEELFSAPVEARRRLLEALLLGDGRTPRNRKCYGTVSRKLADSVLRLATELGIPAYIREEQDNREHVSTTNWVVSMHQTNYRQFRGKAYVTKAGSAFGNNWSKIDYDGTVYCATVPGGLLLTRGAENHVGYWSGNSSKAGVDVRMNWGARMGSNGRIYQVLRNRKTGKLEWKAPHELDGKNLKLPD